MLGKPIITTKGTIVEKKVIDNNIGWAVEEDIDELRQLIYSISKEDIKIKGDNAISLWNETFKNYLKVFFNQTYSKIIR